MKILELAGSRVIGPPSNWDQELDGPCGSIYVKDHVDLQSGMNQMFTFYRFTDEELEALKGGGVLRLGIMGVVHPVYNMTVLGPNIGKTSPFEDRWDMGEVFDVDLPENN